VCFLWFLFYAFVMGGGDNLFWLFVLVSAGVCESLCVHYGYFVVFGDLYWFSGSFYFSRILCFLGAGFC
jgi:hypothetical protein